MLDHAAVLEVLNRINIEIEISNMPGVSPSERSVRLHGIVALWQLFRETSAGRDPDARTRIGRPRASIHPHTIR